MTPCAGTYWFGGHRPADVGTVIGSLERGRPELGEQCRCRPEGPFCFAGGRRRPGWFGWHAGDLRRCGRDFVRCGSGIPDDLRAHRRAEVVDGRKGVRMHDGATPSNRFRGVLPALFDGRDEDLRFHAFSGGVSGRGTGGLPSGAEGARAHQLLQPGIHFGLDVMFGAPAAPSAPVDVAPFERNDVWIPGHAQCYDAPTNGVILTALISVSDALLSSKVPVGPPL